jgi:hypothetical protein
VQAIIAMARMSNVAPEFGADALITLVESGLIPDRRLQHDLLEEAFALAANAQEKIALKRGSGDSATTSALHGAFRNGIDQASLRARAVESMIRLDYRAARELFERIELPIQPSTGCGQQTVPDFTIYYVTMLDVARITPGRELLEGFFAAHLPRFRSAAQITPFARVLMQIRGIENMPAVIDAFSARLPDLMQDSRVFSSTFEESIEAIGQLVTSSPMSSRERLIQQSRAWVMRSIDNGVCAESPKFTVGFDGSHRPAPVTDPVTQFNREVAWHSRNAHIDTAVIARDAAPSLPNSPQYFDFFRTHLLLARDDEGALDLPRWRNETADYIARLAAWSWPSSQIVSNIVSFRDPDSDAAVSEARQHGALKEPRLASVVGEAVSPTVVVPTMPPLDESAQPVLKEARQDGARSDAANFYLEKSDLLTHVLFIERHAPPSTTSGPVKITWSGAAKREGPRVEIPSRDQALTALVKLFDSEAAHRTYTDRRAVWFSPMRDLLSIAGMPDLYAAANHPVLNLYGHLAKLVALR